MWSTHENDFVAATQALTLIFTVYNQSQADKLSVHNYRKDFPVPPHLLGLFFKGIRNGSPATFIEQALVALPNLSHRALQELCNLLMYMCQCSQPGLEPASSFMRAISRSRDLFAYLLSVARDPGRARYSGSDGSDEMASSRIFYFFACLANLVRTAWHSQRGPFLKTCRQTGLLETLEWVLPQSLLRVDCYCT